MKEYYLRALRILERKADGRQQQQVSQTDLEAGVLVLS